MIKTMIEYEIQSVSNGKKKISLGDKTSYGEVKEIVEDDMFCGGYKFYCGEEKQHIISFLIV